jgi:hypothetical protein
LEFVFGHTVHFIELVNHMVWGIAVLRNQFNVYVVPGGRYTFSERRIPPGVYEASAALSFPKETRSRRKSMLEHYCCVAFLLIVGSCWYHSL